MNGIHFKETENLIQIKSIFFKRRNIGTEYRIRLTYIKRFWFRSNTLKKYKLDWLTWKSNNIIYINNKVTFISVKWFPRDVTICCWRGSPKLIMQYTRSVLGVQTEWCANRVGGAHLGTEQHGTRCSSTVSINSRRRVCF